ncbi:MAG: hypothetical protein IT553_08530 [Sphingomonadaceae bacterium]|nr:hypothetical protein [Sphingomonadaceae bacterium]
MTAKSRFDAGGARFYFRAALVVAVCVIAGFGLQAWRFGVPGAGATLVHLHAFFFMGWVAIFVAQSWLGTGAVTATDGRYRARHRALGVLGAFWVVAMLPLGILVTLHVIQRGATPFFFQPQYFLIANPLSLLAFAMLVVLALAKRRDRAAHMRLQYMGMASLLGPAFGRLLPMPLLAPYAWDAAQMCGILFILFAMARDYRQVGRVHATWWWGVMLILLPIILAHMLSASPVGDALYAWVVAGQPAEHIAGMALGIPGAIP